MSWRTTLSVFKRNVISSIIYRSSTSCQKKKQESCAPPLPSEHGKANTFRLISLCVIPVILLLTFQVLINTERSEYGPPFVPYEHLRIRNKRFPWGEGQKSLFHHPDFNALPDGYEEGRGPPEKESEELEDDEGPEEVCNEITDVSTTEESK